MRIYVFTKNWGRNFTGATLATQYLVARWLQKGMSVDVFTLNIGEYNQEANLQVFQANTISELKKIVEKQKQSNTGPIIGYSDDHFGYVLDELSIPYVHTYHGNWPDAKHANVEMWMKSFYFMPLYKKTITAARFVVNVSKYMESFTSRFNPNSTVIHNGIEIKQCEAGQITHGTYLMVGNVEKRKYGLLPNLAKYLNEKQSNIRIDVYGRVLDLRLAKQIKECNNVLLLGEKKDIPYKNYSGLINTSKIENLSISVCEAIKNQLPVFCFKVGGLPEVVLENKTGFLFDCYDIPSMGKGLIKYSLGEQLPVSSEVLADFDWNIAGDKYISLMMENL